MKKKILAVLIMASILFLPGLSRGAAPAEIFKRARSLFNRGRYIEAAAEYRKAVEADPLDVNARVGLGLSYYEAGKFGLAMAAFEKVLELDPKDRRGYNYLGIIYMDTGLYDEAVDSFTRLTELDPQNADAIADLGAAYYRAGKTDESIELFKKALSIRPYLPLAHKNLAFAYSVQKKWPEAIDEIALARTIDAQSRDVEFTLRDILDQALPYMERRARDDPGDPSPHYYIAYASMFRGATFDSADWKRAMEEIDRAVKLDPKNARFCVGKALILTIQGAFAKAIAVSKECVKLAPDDWQAWKGLAEEELAIGNADEGLYAAGRAEKISPEIISVQENLGMAWSQKADDEKALEHFRYAERLGAQSGVLEFDLSVTYHNLKNFDMAWRHARRAQMLGYRDADELIKALGGLSKEPEDY